MKSKLSQIMDNVQQNSGIMIQPVAQTSDRTFTMDHDMKRPVWDMLVLFYLHATPVGTCT